MNFMLVLLIAAATNVEPCLNPDFKARIHELTAQAIDEAYRRHVIALFTVWLNNPDEMHWKSSIDKSVKAYNQARLSLQAWDPPVCDMEQ